MVRVDTHTRGVCVNGFERLGPVFKLMNFAINAKFAAVFARHFDGGYAASDVLESNITEFGMIPFQVSESLFDIGPCEEGLRQRVCVINKRRKLLRML